MNRNDEAGHLAGDRRRIHGRHGADPFQMHRDVALPGRRRRHIGGRLRRDGGPCVPATTCDDGDGDGERGDE